MKSGLTITRSLHRIRQKYHHLDHLDHTNAHFNILKKLYHYNGLDLKITCGEHPEQYEVFSGNTQIAYYRLRHGVFTVECPDVFGELIYEYETIGSGSFHTDERFNQMSIALRKLINHILHL